MKLTYITIQNRSATTENQNMGPFCPGINFIYGERNAGKTAFQRWLRDLMVNDSSRHSNEISSDLPISNHHRFRSVLLGEANQPNPIEIIRDFSGHRDFVLSRDSQIGNSTNPTELTSYLNQIDAGLYDLIHGFSFRQTNQSFSSLKRLLIARFHVPQGKVGDGQAELEWQKKQQQYQSLQEKIETLRQRQSELSIRRQGIQNELATSRGDRLQKLAPIDSEIGTIKSRLESVGHDLTSSNRLDQVTREIAELSQQIIQLSQRRISVPSPVSPLSKEYFSQLYARLDELDEHIRHGKTVQEMVQQRRLKLKIEMDSWNEMTVDDLQHPYHQVRQILLDLESQVNQTDHQAKQWESNPANHTDPTQAVRSIKQICTTMRDGLYDLGEELNQQFTQIRHRAAASELKHLRHLFDQVAEHLNTLMEFRRRLLVEIRQTDASGAEAIFNARPDFIQFAIEQGFWQARLKHVGPWPVVARAVDQSINLEPYHQRMALLETEKIELLNRFDDSQRQADALKSQLPSLELERQRWLIDRDTELLEQLQPIDREMGTIQNELARLTNQLSELSLLPKPTPNPILSRANEIIQAVPEFKINQIWLAEKESGRWFEVQLADRSIQPAEQLSAMAQDAVYLALVAAIRESIRAPQRSLPIVIDDAFVNVPRQQADWFVRLFSHIQKAGHQLILLTNHQYLADRFPGALIFELPGPVTMPQPSLPIEREFNSEIVVTPPVRGSHRQFHDRSKTSDTFSDFQAWDDAVAAPFSPRQETSSPTTRSRESVYPFSKYAHASDHPSFLHPEFFEHDRDRDILRPIRIKTPPSPVPIETIADRLSLAPALEDETLLESLQLLKIDQLRALNELQIESVADLLALEYEVVAESMRGYQISRDQVANWQATIWLLSTVPGLSLTDARLLVACGILETDQIATSHADLLLERVSRFLATREGSRYGGNSCQIPRNRINEWQQAIRSTRTRWKSGRAAYAQRIIRDRRSRSSRANSNETGMRSLRSSNRSASFAPSQRTEHDSQRFLDQQNTDQRGQRVRSTMRDESLAQTPRLPRMATPQPATRSQPPTRPHSPAQPPAQFQSNRASFAANEDSDRLRFYLDLQDHIESAPSIGPKTAARFEKIGIRTVDQFLVQTAESMASKLNYKRITPDLVRDWQHQSRLVCRIPNLRGHDAQLLVACGYREPEVIAEMTPQNLLDVILPFSRTKDGLKIIRTGKEPDLEEITNWIDWAGKTRSLNAA